MYCLYLADGTDSKRDKTSERAKWEVASGKM